jgi:hypothetical protein
VTRGEKKLAEVGLQLIDAMRSAQSPEERATLSNLMELVAAGMRAEGRRAAKGRAHRAKYRPVGTI